MVLDGVVPEPILAGLDPVLRWGVDLGYDRTTPANVPTPFTLLPTFNPVTAASELPKAIADGIDAAASAANVPLAAPVQSESKPLQSNSTQVQPTAKPAAPTRPRPLQILRESLKFGPENRPSTTRSSGGGPLKRIVNVLTGLRPESGATDESADAPKPEQQQDNQDDEAA